MLENELFSTSVACKLYFRGDDNFYTPLLLTQQTNAIFHFNYCKWKLSVGKTLMTKFILFSNFITDARTYCIPQTMVCWKWWFDCTRIVFIFISSDLVSIRNNVLNFLYSTTLQSHNVLWSTVGYRFSWHQSHWLTSIPRYTQLNCCGITSWCTLEFCSVS